MTDPTPGQQQAGFLRALAGHLDSRPGLPPVNISDGHGGGWQLQAFAEGASGLVAWARSLGTERLSAMAIVGQDWSAVRVYGRLEPFRVEVYTRVDGFPREVTKLTVSDLEHFATHGTLPGGVQR